MSSTVLPARDVKKNPFEINNLNEIAKSEQNSNSSKKNVSSMKNVKVKDFRSAKLDESNDSKINNVVFDDHIDSNTIRNDNETIESLKIALVEEKRIRQNMQKEYERHIDKLRADNISQVANARASVLREVDFILKKYSRLTQEAMHAARCSAEKAELTEVEIKKKSEMACKIFEQDCKEKLHEVLDGYKYLADKVAEQSEIENKSLKERCFELEKRLTTEKALVEQRGLELYQEKIDAIEINMIKLQRENHKLKRDHEEIFKQVKNEITREIMKTENMLISACLSALWEFGIEISEAELRKKIATSISE